MSDLERVDAGAGLRGRGGLPHASTSSNRARCEFADRRDLARLGPPERGHLAHRRFGEPARPGDAAERRARGRGRGGGREPEDAGPAPQRGGAPPCWHPDRSEPDQRTTSTGILVCVSTFLGLAAQQQRGHAAPPVRGHHDQVAGLVLRVFDDGFPGVQRLDGGSRTTPLPPRPAWRRRPRGWRRCAPAPRRIPAAAWAASPRWRCTGTAPSR